MHLNNTAVCGADSRAQKNHFPLSSKAPNAPFFDDVPSAFNAHVKAASVLVRAGWHRTETGFSAYEDTTIPHCPRVELRPDGVAVAHDVRGVSKWQASPFRMLPTTATPWALWLCLLHNGNPAKAARAAMRIFPAVAGAVGGAA